MVRSLPNMLNYLCEKGKKMIFHYEVMRYESNSKGEEGCMGKGR